MTIPGNILPPPTSRIYTVAASINNRHRAQGFRTERKSFVCCSSNYTFIAQCVGYSLLISCMWSKSPMHCLGSSTVWSLQIPPRTSTQQPFYLWRCSRDKKCQDLSACTTLMFVFWPEWGSIWKWATYNFTVWNDCAKLNLIPKLSLTSFPRFTGLVSQALTSLIPRLSLVSFPGSHWPHSQVLLASFPGSHWPHFQVLLASFPSSH